MMDKIHTFFRDIKYGFISYRNWYKLIWKDRQWDHYFILAILYKKLDLMVKFRERNLHCSYVNDEKDLMDIRKARDAIKRLRDDDYILIYDDYTESLKQQMNDLDIAFRTMRDNILKWWD